MTQVHETLGGDVGGVRLPDGRWQCVCGEVVNDQMTLYVHRRAAHVKDKSIRPGDEKNHDDVGRTK